MNKDLKDSNKKYARLLGKDARNSNFEMRKQSLLAIEKTINKMQNVDEFTVGVVHDEEIKGPMKWIILILGPNHHARNIKRLLHDEYKNLNIIVVLI